LDEERLREEEEDIFAATPTPNLPQSTAVRRRKGAHRAAPITDDHRENQERREEKGREGKGREGKGKSPPIPSLPLSSLSLSIVTLITHTHTHTRYRS
jgi:hypothetical protein